MSSLESPIPLSDLEDVLAWVDTFKLSRATKKINRDFSDAVLLAEMLAVHYPKLVEMHNYPPRNSLALKLNNWMTLNRKVLKKLKITLCCNTMEQLANSAPGVIERVLLMVHDKIRRDEELNKSMRDAEQNVSSGGSYYEALENEDQVLVVPVKTRVNGVLETIQQKVVSHDAFVTMKEELKDARDINDVLKQKVEHLDSLLKLKDERIEELMKQLERKATRRKETEVLQNSLTVPFETIASPAPNVEDFIAPKRVPSVKSLESVIKIIRDEPELKQEEVKTPKESRIPVARPVEEPKVTVIKVEEKAPLIKPEVVQKVSLKNLVEPIIEIARVPSKTTFEPIVEVETKSYTIIKDKTPSITKIDEVKPVAKKSSTQVAEDIVADVCRIKSDIFKEAEFMSEKTSEGYQDSEDFKDSEPFEVLTIEDTIHKEIVDIGRSVAKASSKQEIGPYINQPSIFP